METKDHHLGCDDGKPETGARLPIGKGWQTNASVIRDLTENSTLVILWISVEAVEPCGTEDDPVARPVEPRWKGSSMNGDVHAIFSMGRSL